MYQLPMSKLDRFLLISILYPIYQIVIIRIGFILKIPIQSSNSVLLCLTYIVLIALILYLVEKSQSLADKYSALGGFILLSIVTLGGAYLLSLTYDTSWDGQGYHQSAIIAYSNGWNPIYEGSIKFKQELPSQIFAEGYPSAIWELQSVVYTFVGKINSAKVINFSFAILAFFSLYILFRKIHIGKGYSVFIAMLITLQPVFLVQSLTFMQDAIGYQLFLLAASSLAIFTLDKRFYWSGWVFFAVELLLVSSKYSHLPIALIIGFVFGAVIVNRYMNEEYVLTRKMIPVAIGMVLVCSIFAYVPYIRNVVFHNAMFYPTNIPDLMGSVKYNNIPNNLAKDNKFALLFYGLFSQSQSRESGDPRSKDNIARLKIPFTTSIKEINDSASLHNNRVGAAGPLFSGILIVCILINISMYFKASSRNERYCLYISWVLTTILLFLALLTPTPNLLRYSSQLELLPFTLIVPLFVGFTGRYIKYSVLITLILILLNLAAYFYSVARNQVTEQKAIHTELTTMKNSGYTYSVNAQQFYSNYYLLAENGITFTIADKLPCSTSSFMHASSTTTRYCVIK